MNPEEFKEMVDSVRTAESALGTNDYLLTKKQVEGRQFARSLYISMDIKKGEILTEQHIRSVRPGFGLHPKYFQEVIGRKVNRDCSLGDRLDLDYLD